MNVHVGDIASLKGFSLFSYSFTHGYPSFATSVGEYPAFNSCGVPCKQRRRGELEIHTCRMYSNDHAVLLTSFVIVLAWQDTKRITPVAGVLHNSQPAAACIVEFAGGPGSWVARTYTATKGGGAFFNGQRLETSSTSAINQSLLVGNGAPVSHCSF